MNFKRIIAAITAGTVCLACLAGCGKKNTAAVDGVTKLSWWVPLYPAISQTVTNFSELEFYQQLQKKNNVEIEFIHPAVGQETVNFNVMIASDDLADIITGGAYNGGNLQAIQNGYYIALNNYIDKYAPNFKKLLDSNDEYRKAAIEEDGTYSQFPFFRGDNFLLSWQGPQIRKDWLDELGMELPETIDEWEKVLTAFKNKGVDYPLTLNLKSITINPTSMFWGAYGIGGSWYEVGGTVHCAFLEDGFVKYLKTMNKWYKNGLLDPDFYAQDDSTHDAKITSGRTGAWVATGGGALGRYLKAFKENNPDAKISGTKYASLKKGEMPMFGFKDSVYDAGMCVKVTADCENPEAAVKLLDWGYSDEGHMFYNFGEENVSYKMENGYPKYTELITKNPNGLDMSIAMVHHMASSYGGAFVQDKRYYEQYLQFEEQRDAVSKWSQYQYSNRMPKFTLTSEEQSNYTSASTDINTYIDEMFIKFVVGEESIDNYDSFVAKLKTMGIDNLLKINQDALNRYNNK